MKKKLFRRAISVVLILASVLFLPNSIVGAAESNVSQPSKEAMINTEQKISQEVHDKIAKLENEGADLSAEKIPVWIWFADIDQEKVENQVQKATNLTADNLATLYEPVPDDLLIALENASEKTDDTAQSDPTNGKLKSYLKATESQRKQEKQRTDAYVKARRNAARDAYAAKNSSLVTELNLPKNEIIFQSQLTRISHRSKKSGGMDLAPVEAV